MYDRRRLVQKLRKLSCQVNDLLAMQNPDLVTPSLDLTIIQRSETCEDSCFSNSICILSPGVLEMFVHLSQEASNIANSSFEWPAFLPLPCDQTRPQDNRSMKAQSYDILL